MKVELRIGSQLYSGWKSINITKSLTQAASGFTLSVSENYPATGEQIAIKPTAECQILVDGTPLLTGYIDSVELRFDKGQHERTIKGRSKTQDLIDCSVLHSSGQFRNQKITQIAKTLCEPYGISVNVEGDDDTPIADFQIENGETVFSALERLARQKRFMCTDTADGALRLIHEPSNRANDALHSVADGSTSNILSGSVSFNVSQRYSKVEFRSQAEGTDTAFGDAVNKYTASASDLTIPRLRQLTKTLETSGTQTDCEKRAKWEVAARVGASTKATYKVQGWQQSDGALWIPGLLVSVKDDFSNLNTEMVIAACSYELSESGTFTTMALVPPETFAREPAVTKKAQSTGVWEAIARDVADG